MPSDITGLSMVGGLLQSEPQVPKFNPIDTTKQQGKAVAGNITNLPDIQKLAGQTNMFNQEQLDKMLESAIPGFHKMLGDSRDRISGFLKGELPQDVVDSIGRSAAFKSLSGGYGGSGMARNLVARDLGLSSLQLMQSGLDAATRWLTTARQTAVAPQFDPSSMFVTPAQRIGVAEFNTTGQFQRDWMKNQLDAQFSTGTIVGQGLTDIGQGITGLATSAAGSAAGGGAI